jgi:hypothetical protein
MPGFLLPTARSLTKRNLPYAEMGDINHMKKPLTILFVAAPMIWPPSVAIGQNVVANAPDGPGATTIYRQVMPDGRIVYSDTVTKGVKVDRILSVPSYDTKSASKSVPAVQTRGSSLTKNPAGSEESGR